MLQTLCVHVIEIHLVAVAVNAPLPSVTSSILTYLCLNILYMWGEWNVHMSYVIVLCTARYRCFYVQCNNPVCLSTHYPCKLDFLFSFNFSPPPFSGEGCPADHGQEFKTVKRSWVCPFLLDIFIPWCMYYCKIVIRISFTRIKFNCILKWTSIAIMMRDDGNTLHSCLINSCCVLKVDDINLSCFKLLWVLFVIFIS